MVHSRVLLNDGSSAVLLNDGISFVLLNTEGPPHVVAGEGGGSGGKSKSVGAQSLADQQIGERPRRRSLGMITLKLGVRTASESKALLHTGQPATIQCRLGPFRIPGYSISQLQSMAYYHAEAKLRYLSFNEISGTLIDIPKIMVTLSDLPKTMSEVSRIEKKNSKLVKLMGLFSYYNLIESTTQTTLIRQERTFDFDETTNDEQLRAFTHSSSFVGNVRYNQDEQSMRILLNGIAYEFCSVPERIFDAFEGADSKGAYFGRNIKGQFNC